MGVAVAVHFDWLQNKFGNEKDGRVCCELKVVRLGTNEYSTAKHLKELFMEFLSHQRRLHQRLAMEEQDLLQYEP